MLKTIFKNKAHIIVFISAILITFSVHMFALSLYMTMEKRNYTLFRTSYLHYVAAEAKVLEEANQTRVIEKQKSEGEDDRNFTITAQPIYPLIIKNNSFKAIDKAVPKAFDETEFSIPINNQWVNYSVKLKPRKNLILMLLSQLVQLIIIFGLFAYVWRFNRFSPILNEFRSAAEKLGIDLQNTSPIKVNGPSQVQLVAEAMNKMQSRIKELLARRARLVASVSHDLKTPITRMQLQLENIDHPEKIKIQNNLDEMKKMVSQIIKLVQLDGKTEKKRKLDVISLLQTTCDNFEDMGSNITFQTESNHAVLLAEPISLKRAFQNIIQNGLKYGTQIDIYFRQLENTYQIIVEDNGPGINIDELEKLFQPFYRSHHVKQKKQGSGLGLTIAKEIITLHNGTITLMNRDAGGLRVVIEFIL